VGSEKSPKATTVHNVHGFDMVAMIYFGHKEIGHDFGTMSQESHDD
jgi:hypothetical protein